MVTQDITKVAALNVVLRAAGEWADHLAKAGERGHGGSEAADYAQRIRLGVAFLRARPGILEHCPQGCGELNGNINAGPVQCSECGWGTTEECPRCGREPSGPYPWWDGHFRCAGCGLDVVAAGVPAGRASAKAFREALNTYIATDGPHLDSNGSDGDGQ